MNSIPTKRNVFSLVGGYLLIAVLVIGPLVAIALERRSAQVVQQAIARAPAPTDTLSPADIRAMSRGASYDNLARYTEEYVGEIVHIQGEVVQVVEDMSGDMLLMHVDDGDIVLVHYDGGRVLRNDRIDLYATVEGRTTYITVLGARSTVPELTARLLRVHTTR